MNRLELSVGYRTRVSKSGKKSRLYRFNCMCGRFVFVEKFKVKSGHTKSCGCLKKEKFLENRFSENEHGMENTPTYHSWRSMKKRCDDHKNVSFYNYGARGITYDKEWKLFKNFLKDMGKKPNGYSLDRIDNEKGYFKENCRWATFRQQARNKRNNIIIEGEKLADLAEKHGVELQIAYSRYKNGMSFKRIFSKMSYRK